MKHALCLATLALACACAHDAPVTTTKATTPTTTPTAKPFDAAHARGGAMVKVAGGRFTMGVATGDKNFEGLSIGAHAVVVPSLYVDVTEVTVAAFAECVAASKCAPPKPGMFCNWTVDLDPNVLSKTNDRGQHPMNCVDLAQAKVFCAWADDKRIPTEAEWEFVARGTAGRVFPWGDAPASDQLCWDPKGDRQGTCPVASFPAGATPEGVQDMAGNVREWVEDELCPYRADDDTYGPKRCATEKRVNRGGQWNVDLGTELLVRSTYRSEALAENANYFLGFRCVRSAE